MPPRLITLPVPARKRSHNRVAGAETGIMERFSFDSEYVRRLVEGDVSIEAHFTAYFGQLLTIKLRARIRSIELLEDIRQETFLRVLRVLRRDGIEHPERIGALVNSVCNNVMFEQIRASSRETGLNEEGHEVPDYRPDAESGLVTEERKRRVREALAEMSGKERDLLRAIFYDEIDKDEVCARYNVTRDHLRVLLFRAKTRLQRNMNTPGHRGGIVGMAASMLGGILGGLR